MDSLILPEGAWMLDCLDLERVRVCMESGGLFRLRVAHGRVFRDRLPWGTPS